MVADRVVLASSNKGKLRELEKILHQENVELLQQSEFGITDAEETGLSFVENAIIKARHACEMTGLPSIADDSGIEVDANNTKLLEALEYVTEAKRTARFQCIIVYLRHATDPVPLICQGTWEGRILTEACGSNGFGYDPLFYVPSHQCASAELPVEIKNAISHRGQALQKLLKCWNSVP